MNILEFANIFKGDDLPLLLCVVDNNGNCIDNWWGSCNWLEEMCEDNCLNDYNMVEFLIDDNSVQIIIKWGD